MQIFYAEMLSSDRKMQDSSFFENTAQGMLSGVSVYGSFTDEDSRDSTIEDQAT